ncbi:hypothetical protein PIB30_003812 [Stylosanthes scabra]|uniref:Uncharacterized protein n=1 Tax=Stylosanthes scabra TaxID=79078 RepID=A0ABU6S2Y6_9FABA|nr:hypothetical protein [Stylosanthes scabra]
MKTLVSCSAKSPGRSYSTETEYLFRHRVRRRSLNRFSSPPTVAVLPLPVDNRHCRPCQGPNLGHRWTTKNRV